MEIIYDATELSKLKDPILIPSKNVRKVFDNMSIRTKSANNKRTDKFKGDDNEGGFHEEAGYFSENGIVEAKPGPKTDPSNKSGSANPFIPADPKDRVNVVGKPLGTVHTHPNGSKNGYEFIQSVSIPADLTALRAAKKAGWIRKNGYGIVIATQRNNYIFYDENGIKFSISQSNLNKVK